MFDPNENLKRQREIAGRILLAEDADVLLRRDAQDLAALCKSLDEWFLSGGYPPDAWRVKIHGGAR